MSRHAGLTGRRFEHLDTIVVAVVLWRTRTALALTSMEAEAEARTFVTLAAFTEGMTWWWAVTLATIWTDEPASLAKKLELGLGIAFGQLLTAGFDRIS